MNNERYFALGTLALSVAFSTGVVQIPNNYVEDFSPRILMLLNYLIRFGIVYP